MMLIIQNDFMKARQYELMEGIVVLMRIKFGIAEPY
jgi:hypothetical protein